MNINDFPPSRRRAAIARLQQDITSLGRWSPVEEPPTPLYRRVCSLSGASLQTESETEEGGLWCPFHSRWEEEWTVEREE